MPAQAWVMLIVGSVAAVGVIVTWQQRKRADRRSEWWRRTQWAFERALSTDDAQARLGWQLLTTLTSSKLATSDDEDLIQVIGEQVTLWDSC